ncbi:MAG: Ppx/GppA family phosphatase, partial [Myxococcota bacterium]|nr:Ppx/GppA family phosphatase [Myxococcota bacterium]
MPHSATSTLAAIDLGSNSFHMIVARLSEHRLVILDKLNEHVRLAAGLDRDKHIQPDAWERATAVLERFGQRVRDLPHANVRAVGTNTLRKARNSASFLREASDRLGHDIEIVSGEEEARLVYLGVCHDLEQDDTRRLVVDIGGGSTELIVGEGYEPLTRDSMQMGCVTFTAKFFPDGLVTAERMARAETAARLVVRSREREYRQLGWKFSLGASGTIRAVDTILRTNRWSERGITKAGVDKLVEALIEAGDMGKVHIDGLSAQRAQVLPGGLAVLSCLFERLDIAEMTASDGALR